MKTNIMFMTAIFIALLLVVLCGCDKIQEKYDVDAIYLHEPGHYSVMIKEGSELLTKDFGDGSVRIFTDVTNGQSCYYEAVYTENIGYVDGVRLHVRSSDDIKGAGWTVKTGGTTASGTTQKIE